MRRRVASGVPQGSVLAATLWNLGYDPILRSGLPSGAQLVGYADDTLLVVSARGFLKCRSIANIALCKLLRSIQSIGHIDYVESKALNYINNIRRILPNLNGPSELVRRLYNNTFNSIVLYAAPVWSEYISHLLYIHEESYFYTNGIDIQSDVRCSSLHLSLVRN